MEHRLSPTELRRTAAGCPVLDVRSPGEFAQGHIPGAISFPLFSDPERAAVGTAYKQQGPEPAFELGLELVGPKMAGFVRRARQLVPGREASMYCWRGGQRSGSMAWLLRQAGLRIRTLEGGYKAYRTQVLAGFDTEAFVLRVVGGRTGTGKTRILQALRQAGEQVLDLEALARHKGSAFGFIGESPQPTVEQFENDLHHALGALDAGRRIWVENESRSIGRVYIPAGFWRQMQTAPLLEVLIPPEVRMQNLLADYAGTDKADLEAAFVKIARKLGGQHLKTALEALSRDDFAAAADVALRYYDKTYQHGLEHHRAVRFHQLEFPHGDPGDIARQLIEADRQP